MALVVLEHFLASSTSPPSVIVLDVEATADPVQGEQAPARDQSSSGG
jgi:hypothetical protein